MEGIYLVALVAIDLSLLVALAVWASRGGTLRVMVGLALSALFGVLLGVPVYALAVLVLRARRKVLV